MRRLVVGCALLVGCASESGLACPEEQQIEIQPYFGLAPEQDTFIDEDHVTSTQILGPRTACELHFRTH